MLILFLAVLPGAGGKAKKVDTPKKAYPVEMVSRGAYLVNVGGCNSCHTPHIFDAKKRTMAPDTSRILSGHPEGASGPLTDPTPGEMAVSGDHTSFKGTWGVTYAANLTPDKDTGLGKWMDKDFILAIRKGKVGDHFIQPPMPWEALSKMTDEDLTAIYVYLQTIPPIKNNPAKQPVAAKPAKAKS